MAQIIKDVNIGEAIKKIMAKKKIYQKDIAEALNFTQPYMNKLLSKQSIATDRLVQISNIIGYNFFHAVFHGSARAEEYAFGSNS